MLLYARDAAFINFSCGRGVRRLLHLGPIRRFDPFVGRVLRARGYRVLEALQGVSDRVGHGDDNVIALVIPFYGKPAVLAAIWVNSYGAILLEGVKEVGGIVGGKYFDAKVIESKGEGGRKVVVGPKTRGACHRSIAVGMEFAEKAFVGNDSGFIEFVHPLPDLNIDIATCICNGGEEVLNNHLV